MRRKAGFKVGDAVFYPSAGVGLIEGKEDVFLTGKQECCYVIRILESGATIKVPKANIDKNGIRPLLDGKKPKDLTWDGRYLWNIDIGTNIIYKIDPASGDIVHTLPSPHPDSTSGLAGRLPAALAHLHVPVDVFQDDNSVIDQHPNRKCHPRQTDHIQ